MVTLKSSQLCYYSIPLASITDMFPAPCLYLVAAAHNLKLGQLVHMTEDITAYLKTHHCRVSCNNVCYIFWSKTIPVLLYIFAPDITVSSWTNACPIPMNVALVVSFPPVTSDTCQQATFIWDWCDSMHPSQVSEFSCAICAHLIIAGELKSYQHDSVNLSMLDVIVRRLLSLHYELKEISYLD